MKKAKSHDVAYSLDHKNDHHHQPPPHHIQFDDDHPNGVVIAVDQNDIVVATNLSRKKSTPPPPGKKLVIKLIKDEVKVFLYGKWKLNDVTDPPPKKWDLTLADWESVVGHGDFMVVVEVEVFVVAVTLVAIGNVIIVVVLITDCYCWVKYGKPTLPINFEENTWAILKSAISAIFLKQPDPCDSEKLYQAVNDLCLHKMGESLYRRIEKECEAHISTALQSLVGQSEDLVVFLSLIEKCWQDFCDQVLIIRGIALYLDRTYAKQTPNVRSIWDMGLQLFRKHLSLAAEVEHKTVFGLLRMIESERLGEAVNRTLLNHLLKMFTALGIYSESFEKPFLERTSEFYAAEGVKYMQQSDVPDYLSHVEIRLHEEHERCLLYLDANTRNPLVATAERQLLEYHISAILDKVIVMDEEKDKDMVSCLLEFKASLDTIWEDSFSKNEAFCNTIKDAFEHLINLRQNQPAELIAKFLDEKLRAGNKGTSEEELEGTLDKVLVLFRFIQLKTECGSQFTNKLEGMFKDIELSKEINESFKQSSQARTKLPSGIEMSVHVLTTGHWPTYPPMDVSFPQELNLYQDIFKEFYLSKYSGRRLMWQNSLGHCVLKAEFPKGKKELAVSLFQTIVLMLFNNAQNLSYQDIKDSTGIEDKELRRTLQSLACGKVRVLQKVDAAIVRIMKTRESSKSHAFDN
ncbi:cullin4 [Actinidia rufa]|uniref:Cullin4 n=1 Tax=Actinidia rufa TaxID=165716 RepID=A0A7J0DUY9_9ERIC|nr:cullin4 [Actinidia rufa]